MRRLPRSWGGVALAFGAFAAAAPAQVTTPEPRPLGREHPTFQAPSDPLAPAAPPSVEPDGVLHLREALAAALLGNPDLAARSYEIRAREAEVLQARRRPAPILFAEVEDVAGSGDFRGADEAQSTLLLGQLVELGGKRTARARLAAAEQELAGWDYEAERIAVFTDTADAFVEVLAAQERLRLADEALGVARAVRRVAADRVAAGLASPAEEIRAAVAVDAVGVEREHADHELETARTALAARWGGEARFERAEGDLGALPVPPPLAELQRRALEGPDLGRWAAELESRDAALARVRSERIPDLMISGGPRHLNGSDDVALVLSASLPIPLWSRNQDAIAAARHRSAKIASERRAAEVRVSAAVSTALTALRASTEEAALLERRVLPGFERALVVLRRGYEEGRHTQLEVLEGVRAQLAAREQRLRALAEAQHSVLQIERLTGAPLEERR